MNLEELVFFLSQKRAVSESFPFDEDTLVFKVGGKMFALIALERFPRAINLKCDPERSLELRESYSGITPGYHMSKKHWNTVHLEEVPLDLLKELIDHSYDLVVAKMTKKERTELGF